MKKIIILSAITALTLSADPLATYIGAKAKAMGGAFTAVANNNSAMYFNPAGLVNFDGLENTMLTFEAGTGAKRDQEGATFEDEHTSSGSYFFGISSIGTDAGFGFAMYSLYDLNLQYAANSYVKEEVEVMSISGAFKLIDQLYPYGGKLSLGVTGAYASSFSGEADDTLDVGGYFYAIGLKYRALNHHALKIDIGANYRSAATLESDSELYVNTFIGVGVPQETAFGVAFSYGTEFGLFTLAGDYKDTAYEEATTTETFPTIHISDVTTTNIGLEFATSLYQLRAGTYKSAYSDDTIIDGDVTGITAGAGVVIAGSFSLEVAYDNRTYTRGTEEATTPFYTVSGNMAF